MILGLNGAKGSGKDTAGDYLAEIYGFEKLSFAYLLKASAAALFDIPIEDWETLKNEDDAKVTLTYPNGVQVEMTVRVFLQRYGTEAHREFFGVDFWIEAAWRYYSIEPDKHYVWTDARFENELRSIRAGAGQVLRIDRASVLDGDAHASEKPAPPELVDVEIDNNLDGYTWLYEQLDALCIGRYGLEFVGTSGGYDADGRIIKSEGATA